MCLTTTMKSIVKIENLEKMWTKNWSFLNDRSMNENSIWEAISVGRLQLTFMLSFGLNSNRVCVNNDHPVLFYWNFNPHSRCVHTSSCICICRLEWISHGKKASDKLQPTIHTFLNTHFLPSLQQFIIQ